MEKEDFLLIGEYLKNKRSAKNLTQSQVSQELNLTSPQFISKIERGQCSPSWKVLKKLIKIYEIPEKEIVDLLLEQQRRHIQKKLKAKIS